MKIALSPPLLPLPTCLYYNMGFVLQHNVQYLYCIFCQIESFFIHFYLIRLSLRHDQIKPQNDQFLKFPIQMTNKGQLMLCNVTQ